MRSITHRRLWIAVIVLGLKWMSLLTFTISIMFGSAHSLKVAVVLWTSDDGPTHMARICLVTAYAPSGTLEVHMALIVCRPERDWIVDTRIITVARFTVQSCKEIDLSCFRLYVVIRKPLGLQDSGKQCVDLPGRYRRPINRETTIGTPTHVTQTVSRPIARKKHKIRKVEH